ncbi:alpha/beta fold hydrolase [Nocardia cyriacigeorgica]|uniref:alpha/beta fold hydrolase n=1 Tax=Nocardia cyriacigeorgica TaxID=135487 RepID=UPI001895C5D2|nr:alpha/beta fold hydrolase [Nocardia cyriacigeorgica]MBF6287356.1 alpha/beta fold hydrolase [Nocardia cyriacigeorgica]
MNLLHAAARTTLAVAVSAAAVLATAQAPATAAPAGSVISVTAQPDGWHGVSGGSVVEYWMSGSDGTPRPASGALLLPEGTPPPGGWPIIAYDHGTSGLGMGCGGMSTPETAPFPRLQGRQDQLLRRLVAQGFAVVAPDYLGLGTFDTGPHPYLELRTEATATIDMIRAVRATHPELSSTWAAFGISQGGQAALGTGHLQSTYAPELDFRGTIAVDPESDVEKLLPLAGPNIPELPVVDDALSFVVSILAGLREARPDIAVDQYLTPLGRTVLDEVGDMCLDRIIERVDGLSIGELLARPLSEEPMRTALTHYMAVPVRGYDAPILMLANATDTVVPSPLHAALIAQLAANGVDFRTVIGTGEHGQVDEQMWAAIDAFLAGMKG